MTNAALDFVARFEDATGEQRLIAALLITAAEGCRNGDPLDCEWIRRRAIDCVAAVAPAGRQDLDVLVRKLIPTTKQLRLETEVAA